ncbi:hypothetical protein ABMA32_07530 [Mesorhizobium sp. VNQ89]|uniref:hypothetical protein n=1 Tax=Mesorhizobium quangtriensis TaxID=3157709 RepID=UPI0032B7B46B
MTNPSTGKAFAFDHCDQLVMTLTVGNLHSGTAIRRASLSPVEVAAVIPDPNHGRSAFGLTQFERAS